MKVITKNFEQLKEDRSDIVAHLKRNLEEKIEESRELNERLSALEELRKQEQNECKEKEREMELEYRTMENTLTAEVKLAGNISYVSCKISERKVATFFFFWGRYFWKIVPYHFILVIHWKKLTRYRYSRSDESPQFSLFFLSSGSFFL